MDYLLLKKYLKNDSCEISNLYCSKFHNSIIISGGLKYKNKCYDIDLCIERVEDVDFEELK